MIRFLIIFSGFVLGLTTTLLGQNKRFDAAWLEIELLESEGKVATALEKVTVLLRKAEKQHISEQVLKALLFRWKFLQIVNENSQSTILEEVRTEISKQKYPNKQLLHMYLASFLETYMNDNYWKISARMTTENGELKDYQTWDQRTFLNQISSNYDEALTPYLGLASIPTSEITELLITVPINRKYKPTLYDIIAHKALAFYKNSRSRIQKPKDEFLIDNPSYFSTSKTFTSKKIITTDKESLLYKALKTFQQLEEVHSQQKSETAWAFNSLQRLEFVKNNYIGNNSSKHYLSGLQNLLKEFETPKERAEIELALAFAYRNLSSIKEENNQYKYPNYAKKALEIASKIEKRKISLNTVIKAKNLKAAILQPKLNWITQNNYLPNQEHLAKITYTNAQSATVKAYRVPFDFSTEIYNFYDRDSLLLDFLKNKKALFSKTYNLPQKNDYNSYSTEIKVPKLPLGKYLVQVQTDTLKDAYKYHNLTVTELSVNKTDFNDYSNYQVLHTYKGSPIANATIALKTRDRNNEFSVDNYKTNSWGEFADRKGKRYENSTLTISTPKDTLVINDTNYQRNNSYNYTAENNAYKSKTLLFLDRAIYRPNQTVYFKAIAISEENKKSKVLTDKKIILEVNDPNNETVYTTALITNEYGSIHGNFTLPDASLNGSFTITASLENPKNTKNHQQAYQRFSVEEYKRPTFEVNFLPATKIYKPLDSVSVKGNATAFLGSKLTDASVSYSVKRTIQHRFWWFRNVSKEAKQIATGQLTTDNKGAFTISFKAATDEENTENKIYNYTIDVKVTDINGETRENSTSIKVADKNLLATINTSDNWIAPESPELSIAITDVNNNPIKGNGTVEIYKLQSSGRFLNNRPWPTPDIQQISKSDFENSFPHIPYTNEQHPKNWKKGALYFEHRFTEKDLTTINLTSIKKWPAGKYIVVTTVTDPQTNSTTKTEKIIHLQQPKQAFLADEEIFSHTFEYNKSNPNTIQLKLQTAAPGLIVFTEVFDGDISIWKEKITITKGTKKIAIKLPSLTYPNVAVVYKYQIYRKFYNSKDTFDLSPEPLSLKIEKTHFTDKINPGSKEKWRFRIESSNKKAFDAEALASMHDASLDTFKKSYWNTNFGFGKNYPFPANSRTLSPLGTKSVNYSSQLQQLPITFTPNEQLNFYGFEFNRINSWQYRNYLRNLRSRKSSSSTTGIVSGIIFGNDIPLPGATVFNKRNKKEIVTNFDGQFELSANTGDVLQISSIGYANKEIKIGNQKSISIKLLEDLNQLENVVVVGYGSNPKKANRSRSQKLMESPAQMLEGRAIGVSVMNDEAVFEEKEVSGENFNNPEELKVNTEDFTLIQTRKNLQETAFFLPNLHTNNKGEIEFEFDSPEALTRWNFRMLAHTKEAISGELSAQTLTQKELSIIPNAPRFVREGDQLTFTAKVANLTENTIKGIAQLQWTDPSTGNTINNELEHQQLTQPFSIDSKGNALLSWNITIPKNLTAIQYRITAKAGNYTDGEENIIPVLSNRMLVTESIPLWLRAGETTSFSLTNFKPQSATQQPHQITLEYTSNPAWMAIKSLPYLMEFPYQCSEQTFARLYANAMAAHILNSQPKIKTVFESWRTIGTLQSPLETNTELKSILLAESPWLQEARSETEQQQRLAVLFDLEKTARAQQKAINKLRQLQKSNGGFPWFQGGKANPYITRHIVAGFGHLEQLGVTSKQSKTTNIIKNAIHFLDNKLINDYKHYQKHHKTTDGFYKQVSLLHLAYARSFYKNAFPLNGLAKTIIDKAIAYHKTDWQSHTVYEKGMLALVLRRFDKTSSVSNQIITSLIESSVNSKENGMYWKENTGSWWWYHNPITTQALLIELFTETKQTENYIEEMKIFLLKNKRTNRWETTIETTDATYALLLRGNNWLSIKDNTVIKVGGTKIATRKLTNTEKEQGTGYFKTKWHANEISSAFETIQVANKSEVTGFGGYYWQYFENLDAIAVDDATPLRIDKELYKKVVTDRGAELKKITPETDLQIGDKLTVRLLIKSDNDLEFVHLKDMRASGLEPTQTLSGYEYKEGLAYYQSTKDVATHFFIDKLHKGNYVLTYDMIANQAGSFSNGITTLQCMYAPEFSSHSAGQRVDIEK